MGLTSAKKAVAPRSDASIAVVEWNGETLRFRRPTTASLTIPKEIELAAETDFLDVPETSRWYAIFMGLLYVPDPSEGGIKAWRGLCEIARENDLAFSELTGAFEKAFPEFTDWLAGRLKNALTAAVQESERVADLPSPPSTSEDSPANSPE